MPKGRRKAELTPMDAREIPMTWASGPKGTHLVHWMKVLAPACQVSVRLEDSAWHLPRNSIRRGDGVGWQHMLVVPLEQYAQNTRALHGV